MPFSIERCTPEVIQTEHRELNLKLMNEKEKFSLSDRDTQFYRIIAKAYYMREYYRQKETKMFRKIYLMQRSLNCWEKVFCCCSQKKRDIRILTAELKELHKTTKKFYELAYDISKNAFKFPFALIIPTLKQHAPKELVDSIESTDLFP